MGGLGLRICSLHSTGAFISSLCESNTIREEILGKSKDFDHQDLLDLLNSKSGETKFDFEQASISSQKVITHAVESNLMNELKSQAGSDREKARLNSVAMKH